MSTVSSAIASLTVASLVLVGVGFAAVPPDDDGTRTILAVYVDYDAGTGDESNASNGVDPVPVDVPFNLYFVMYYPHTPSGTIGGYEFSWRLHPGLSNPLILSITYPPDALNIGTSSNLIVGLGSPYDFSGFTHRLLVTLTVFFHAAPSGPEHMYLGPSDPSSLPGYMAYWDYDDPAKVLPMWPNSVDYSYDNPVFYFGTGVAAETQAWGRVKALFQ